MSWLNEYAPKPKAGAPFDAVWHTGLSPVAADGTWPTGLADILFPDLPVGLQTYAVLDAACIPNLPGLLATSGLEHACLFQGEAADALAEAAPWLVALTPEARLTQSLLRAGDAPWDLWNSESHIFLHAHLSLSEMRAHLRHFTRLEHEEDGRWYYFRFWQADVIGALALHGPHSLPHLIFGRAGIVQTLLPSRDALLALKPREAAPDRAVPRLDAATWQAFGQIVAARDGWRLVQDCMAQNDAPRDHVEAVLQHVRDWGFRGRNTTRALALWWTTLEGAHMLNQRWAQDELAASRGMPDEVRADRLRNLAEDKAHEAASDATQITEAETESRHAAG